MVELSRLCPANTLGNVVDVLTGTRLVFVVKFLYRRGMSFQQGKAPSAHHLGGAKADAYRCWDRSHVVDLAP
jgi:hypothetical protein